MKNKLLLVVLLMFGIAQAQIVNIPDAALKAQLISATQANHIAASDDIGFFTLDANGDGEVQQSEADLVHTLVIGDEDILSFEGVQYFSNVRFLVINMFNPVSFDVTTMDNLKRLQCQGDISNIVVNGSFSLEELFYSYSTSSTINLENLPELKSIYFLDGAYTNLTFHGLPSLHQIRIEGNPLTNLTLYDLPVLNRLKLTENQLVSLDLSDVPSITIFDASSNPLTTVNLQDLPNLSEVGVSGTNLTEVDLSNASQLNYFHANNAPELQYVNLKNGSNESVYMFGATPNLEYICIDEGDMDGILQAFWSPGPNVQLNTYCTFTPGGSFNTIAGTFNFDSGTGCTGNILGGAISVEILTGSETGTSFTNTGNYSFYTQSGSFIITPQFENDWFTATPASATVIFADNNNNSSTENFCITPNGVHPDVEVVMMPSGNAQPGFDAMYQVVIKNKGNQTLSGDITLTYDDAVLDFVSASPAEASTASGSLTWNYSNLLPFEDRVLYVTMNLNGPMETPPLEIDDELLFNVAATPLTGDETPADNAFAFTQIVTGAFDPNDITCLEGATASPDKIGEYLHYNINFENTGNAAATFIVVKDIINEEQFDISSLQLLNASHDVEVRVEDNKVEFFFDDIQLGPLEKGNVVFKIKTLNTLQVNDDVTQQANIYFDYNWPIETNEANTVFQALSTGDFEIDNSVGIYPNPTVSLVNITASSAIRDVQLYDIQGRLLQVASANDLNVIMDLSNRAAGMYFIKVNTEAGVKVEKLVKK